MQLGHRDRFVALGRDLRAVATLQQQLVEAQMSMERDYSRLRHVETRYRLLFQMSSEPVLIVDAATQKVVEANPARRMLFGEQRASDWSAGRFPRASTRRVRTASQALLTDVRAAGPRRRRARAARERRTGIARLRLAVPPGRQLDVPDPCRLRCRSERMPACSADARSKLLAARARSAPDGFVVTDQDGEFSTANPAFLDMAQLATEEQARGESLDRWLGRSGVDLSVLMANLRQHGSVRLFATTLRGEYGAAAEVEISAVSLPDEAKP